MNLAWSNLSRTTPDLRAAEQYAQAALKMVPYWDYVRDILTPQIQAAKPNRNSRLQAPLPRNLQPSATPKLEGEPEYISSIGSNPGR
jgi:hypothetical protein